MTLERGAANRLRRCGLERFVRYFGGGAEMPVAGAGPVKEIQRGPGTSMAGGERSGGYLGATVRSAIPSRGVTMSASGTFRTPGQRTVFPDENSRRRSWAEIPPSSITRIRRAERAHDRGHFGSRRSERKSASHRCLASCIGDCASCTATENWSATWWPAN